MAFSMTVRRAIPFVIRLRKGLQPRKCLLSVAQLTPGHHSAIAAYYCSPYRLGNSWFIDHNLAKKTTELAKTVTYPLCHVEFTAGRTLSEHATRKELKFNAAYIDTHPGADASTPIVVTVHGAPGSHLDFRNMIAFLPRQNMRVISLNYPGFNWTPIDSENKFGHTATEKAAFLVAFLDAVKVSRVDVLVSHSASVYPSALLCANTSLVRSLLIVNPTGHRFMKSLSPLWYHANHAKFCRNPFLRHILLMVLKLKLIVTKFPNQDTLLVSAQIETMGKLDYEQHQDSMSKMVNKKFPVFMMYSEKDSIVEAEISAELALKLGGSPDMVQHYDSDGKLIQPVKSSKGDQIFRTYAFKKGGHFLMSKHPEIVNQAILDLYHAISKSG